jgi:hypothetical protein
MVIDVDDAGNQTLVVDGISVPVSFDPSSVNIVTIPYSQGRVMLTLTLSADSLDMYPSAKPVVQEPAAEPQPDAAAEV